MRRTVLLTSMIGALWGCAEETVCDYYGEALAAGESTVDEARALRSTCTTTGLECVDASEKKEDLE